MIPVARRAPKGSARSVPLSHIANRLHRSGFSIDDHGHRGSPLTPNSSVIERAGHEQHSETAARQGHHTRKTSAASRARPSRAVQRGERRGRQFSLQNPVRASNSRYARVGNAAAVDGADAGAAHDHTGVGARSSAAKRKDTHVRADGDTARPWHLCSGKVRVSISAYCLISLNSIMFNEIMVSRVPLAACSMHIMAYAANSQRRH